MDPREARKQAMLARMNKSKQTSEGGGLGFFRGDLQNVQFWKCDEGDHELDIIPYFAGPLDPHAREGEFTYVLEVFEHRDVGGIEGQTFICLMKTYGKPCPICQHRQQLIQEGADDELIKALRTSRYPRSIYNVVVYDSEKEQSKGVQVWHTSHWLMEQYLIKLAESSRREIEQGHPPFKYFADPEEGYSVRFTRTGQGQNTRYIAHQLLARNYTIPQDTLNAAYQLDQLIYVPKYDEVYAAYWGTDATTDTGGGGVAGTMTRGAPLAAPPAPPAPAPVAAPAAYPAPAPAAAPAAPEPTYGPTFAPLANAAPAAPSITTDPYAQPGVDPVCPGGGTFGINSYELEYCERCEYWKPCAERNEYILAYAAEQGGMQPAAPAVQMPGPGVAAPAPAPAPAAYAQPPASPGVAAPAMTQPPAQPTNPPPLGTPPPSRQPVGGGVPAGRGGPVGRGRPGGMPAPAPAPAPVPGARTAPAPGGRPGPAPGPGVGSGGGRRIVR